MAAFKVGQRVRITAPGNLHGRQGTIYEIREPAGWFRRMLGTRAVNWSSDAISLGVHPEETAYLVDVDGLGKYGCTPGPFGYPVYWLRPLDDPKADAFLESIRKLKPLAVQEPA